MATLSAIVDYLDILLQPAAFQDYCPNGLQVEGRPEVNVLISGVTACQALIDAAIEQQADAVLVHHGYFWKGEDPGITGMKQRRIKALLENGISLLAYHLPLDIHDEVGNNVQLAERLGFEIEGSLAEGSGPPLVLRAAVVSAHQTVGRILKLAAAPDPANTNQTCELISIEAAATTHWDKYALVLWQGTPPQGESARHLQAFVDAGGVAVFFPPASEGSTNAAGWGEIQTALAESPLRVSRWEEKEGPLENTGEGLSLPLSDLEVFKRRAMPAEQGFLAVFEDGAPFLTRRQSGRGQILYCATLPDREWSQLADGAVLVPMLQRLLESGAQRFFLVTYHPVTLGAGDPGRDVVELLMALDKFSDFGVVFTALTPAMSSIPRKLRNAKKSAYLRSVVSKTSFVDSALLLYCFCRSFAGLCSLACTTNATAADGHGNGRVHFNGG